MQNQYKVLRVIAGLVAAYHLLLGMLLNGPVNWITAVATHVLGATRMPDASALFLARMLGTYLIVFGIGMVLVVWNPVKNRVLLTLGAIVAALRAVQRLAQADDLSQSLGISCGGNWATIVMLLAIAAVLLFLRLQLHRNMARDAR